MKKLLLLFPFFLMACGGGYNPDKALLQNSESLGGTSYIDLGGSRWLMTNPLSSSSTGANFQISFELQDQGHVTLHTFSDTRLADGFELRFERDLGVLKVLATAAGQTQDWSSYFSSVDATQVVTLTIDVHNNERPAHVLVWAGAKNSSLDHDNTLYNTAEDSVDLGFAGSPGNGGHRSWGLSFDNAVITEAIHSEPQESH